METIERITQEIMADPANRSYTERGIPPLFSAPTTARINIVGQAPGVRAQETRLFWNDPSGDRLRAWMGVDRDTFYHSGMFAILPMDFYFPGKGKSGDLAPRRGFAEKWHPRILADLPQRGQRLPSREEIAAATANQTQALLGLDAETARQMQALMECIMVQASAGEDGKKSE